MLKIEEHAMSIASRTTILSAAVLIAVAAWPGADTRAAIMMPAIDDRSYMLLIDELVDRIPVHNPEWTDVNESDPGFALLDFFAFIDDAGLNGLATEFHSREWWKGLPIDGEAYLDELAYSLLEAALTSALPPGKAVPDDWLERYGIDASLGFAELVARARAVPEPGVLALFALGLSGLFFAKRRRRVPVPSSPESADSVGIMAGTAM